MNQAINKILQEHRDKAIRHGLEKFLDRPVSEGDMERVDLIGLDNFPNDSLVDFDGQHIGVLRFVTPEEYAKEYPEERSVKAGFEFTPIHHKPPINLKPGGVSARQRPEGYDYNIIDDFEGDKLDRLISLCKTGSVHITINQHRDIYESAEEYTTNHTQFQDDDIDQEVIKEMVKRDTVIEIQFYPKTPVSFFYVCHYDLDKALDEALNYIEV